ncbi:unnamed protein product [Paramecium primaurelia]|uniref:Rhomboid-like protease n=2 Tax=Paramecium TaxID=5884 RepID=A0A8S1VJC5_9CILI|nr:unnamed protein product [Paramecium primaurelia]CAD8176861.1 unnamed protein product [Paramecium pentaurelia]
MEIPTINQLDLSIDQQHINQSQPQSNKNLRVKHTNVSIGSILFKQFNICSVTFPLSIVLLLYFWILYIYQQVNDILFSCVLYSCGAKFRPDIQHRSQFYRMLISIPQFGGISHIIIGFITIQMYGYISESKYGKLKYSFILFLAGYSSNLMSSLIYPYSLTVGSYGIVFGVLTLYGFIIIQQKQLGQYKKLIIGIYFLVFCINFVPIISINQIDIACIFGSILSTLLMGIFFQKFDFHLGYIISYAALTLLLIYLIIGTTLLFTMEVDDIQISRFC